MLRIIAIILCLNCSNAFAQCAIFSATPSNHAISNFLGQTIARNPYAQHMTSNSPVLAEIAILIDMFGPTFNEVLRSTGAKELFKLRDAVLAGTISMNPQARVRFLELMKIIEADDSILDAENPAARILTRFPNVRGASSEGGLGGTLAGVDTYSIVKFLDEIVDRAVKGNNANSSRVGIGGPVRRFFQPLHSRVAKIIKYVSWILGRLDYAEELENLRAEAIGKMQEQDVSDMNAIWANVQEEVRGVRADVETGFGQPIIEGGPQWMPDLNIYALAPKMAKVEKKSEESRERLREFGEKICDEVDEGIRKKGNPNRNETDYFSPELKIRNAQYTRRTEDWNQIRTNAFSEDTGLDVWVDYEYKVWETRYRWVTTTVNGKTTTSLETYQVEVPRYDSKWISITYKQLLVNRLKMVGWSTDSPGHDGEITHVYDSENYVRSSTSASRFEIGYFGTFWNAWELVAELHENHSANLADIFKHSSRHREVLEQLDDQISALGQMIRDHEKYRDKTDAAITKHWQEDSPEHFKRRNEALQKAAQSLLRLALVYREQFNRRMPEIWISPTLPDYSDQLNTLWWRNFRARGIQTLTGVAAAGFGAVSYQEGGIPEGWDAIVRFITEFVGQ